MRHQIARALGVFLATQVMAAHAADIRIIFPSALAPAVDELIPRFERSSGHKVIMEHGGLGVIATRMREGTTFDVVISAKAQIDTLIAAGGVIRGTSKDVAKGGIGLAVLKGAPKVDVSTADLFKRVILSAPSITYVDPSTGSAVAAYLTGLFQQEGIADSLKEKTVLAPSAAGLFDAVASGKARIGLAQTSEIVAAKGIDLAGVLPLAIQQVTLFDAAIPASSHQADLGQMLIQFLTSPDAVSIFKEKGLGV